MNLFKSGFRGIFKSKFQLIILSFIILISSILTSVILSTSNNLTKANNFIGSKVDNFDYAFRYNALDSTSNDTYFFPSLAFDQEYVEVKNDDKIDYYPTISFGENGAFKNLKESDIITKNNKIEEIKLTINKESDYFKKSLLGKIEDKNKSDNETIKYLEKFKNTLIYQNLIDWTNDYLDCENVSSNEIKIETLKFINKNKNDNEEYTVEVEKDLNGNVTKVKRNDFYDKGLNGQFGNVAKVLSHEYDDNNKLIDVESNQFISSRLDWVLSFDKKYENYDFNEKQEIPSLDYDKGQFKNAVSLTNVFNIYNVTRKKYWLSNDINYSFMNDYYTYYLSLIGQLSNFKITNNVTATLYSAADKRKYKIVNYEPLVKENTLRYFWKSDFFNENQESSVIVSLNLIKNLNLSKNSKFNFLGQDVYLYGIAIDQYNTYPTIYETDIIPEIDTEGIVYMNSMKMKMLYTLSRKGLTSQITNDSRYFIDHTSNTDINKDLKLFKSFMVDNTENLGTKLNNLNNEKYSYDKTKTTFDKKSDMTMFQLKITLFKKVQKIVLIVFIVLLAIFLFLFVLVLYLSLKEIINRDIKQIGTLKSMGETKTAIVLPYFTVIPILGLIITAIGYFVSIFVSQAVMEIFYNYFLIPEYSNFDPIILIILLSFIGLFAVVSSAIISYRAISKSALTLMENKKNKDKKTLWNNISRIKTKKFTQKLSLSVLATNGKNVFSFTAIIFVATAIISLLSLIPIFGNNIANNYYKNIDFNSEYKFQQPVSGDPFSHIFEYDEFEMKNDRGYKTPIPYLYKLKDGEWRSIDQLKDDKSAVNDAIILQNAFFYNFSTVFNQKISIDTFKYMDDLTSNSNKKILESNIKGLITKVLPKLLGKDEIIISKNGQEGWSEGIEKLMNGFIPADLKEEWFKNKDNIDKFFLTINGMKYDSEQDRLMKRIDLKYKKQDLEFYGLENNSFGIDYDDISDEDENTIFVNAIYAKKNKLGINDVVNLSIPTYVSKIKLDAKAGYNDVINDEFSKDGSGWKYNDNQNYIDINNMDLSKFTYKPIKGTNEFNNIEYGYWDDGKISSYYNMENIELWLEKDKVKNWDNKYVYVSPDKNGSKVKRYLFPTEGKNKTNNKVTTISKDGKYYIIRPFSMEFDHYIDDVYDLVKGYPKTWIQAASELGFFNNQKVIVDKEMKIKKIVEGYDKERIFTSSKNLSNILGIKNDNWHNAKITKNNNMSDIKKYYSITNNKSILNWNDFKNFKNSVENYYLIGMQKDIVFKLIGQILVFGLLILIFVLLGAIISISMAIDIYLNKINELIIMLKIFGYNKKDNFKIVFNTIIANGVISWALGFFIVWTPIYVTLQIIMDKIGLYIPTGTGLIALAITLVIFIIVLSISLLIGYKKIKQTNLKEFIS